VEQSVGETVSIERLADRGVLDQAIRCGKRDVRQCLKPPAKEIQRAHKDIAIDKTHDTRDKIRHSVQNAQGQREDRQIQRTSFSVMRRGFNHLFTVATLRLFETSSRGVLVFIRGY
jgi:hypothetical protein